MNPPSTGPNYSDPSTLALFARIVLQTLIRGSELVVAPGLATVALLEMTEGRI